MDLDFKILQKYIEFFEVTLKVITALLQKHSGFTHSIGIEKDLKRAWI